MDLYGRNLLSIDDLTPAELSGLIDLTRVLKLNKKRGNYKKRLTNKNIVLIRETNTEWSTLPFAAACGEEGAYVETLTAEGIPSDTDELAFYAARVLGRLFDLIGISGDMPGLTAILAPNVNKPLINYMNGAEQPIQVLADLFTIYEHFGSIQKLNLCVIGGKTDGLVKGAAAAGMNVAAVAGAYGLPGSAADDVNMRNAGCVRVTADIEGALTGAHAVYMDAARKTVENGFPYNYIADFIQYTKRDDTIVLNGLPSENAGMYAADAFTNNKSHILEQIENRVYAIKAVVTAAVNK